jgi:lichenan operon transcriptional antiterminator
MKESKLKLLVDKLAQSNVPISSSDLAFTLGMSEKTVLKYLNILREELESHGATLRIKQGAGTYLVITDSVKFNEYMSKQDQKDILDNPQSRRIYVLMRLLLADDYLNLYDFSDELYISPSLLRSIIKSLQDIIDQYRLTLKHSHNHGYMITGDEKDIRHCLTAECQAAVRFGDVLNETDLKSDEMAQVSSIIAKALEQFNISISNQGINSLTLHVLIAINRLETQNPIRFEDGDIRITKLRSSPEYYVASYIGREISKQLNTILPENELLYLTMHINGKQRIFGHESLQVEVSEESNVFYNKFLRNIYKMAGVDLFDDEELRTSLLNHIVPFLNRVHNNMQITKSDLLNVKNEFPYAYELALYGLKAVTDSGYGITSAEITYFALHIALSLEKNKESQRKYNALIICDEVTGLFHIISFKLEKYFHDAVNTVKFIDVKDLRGFDFEDYPIVLNTTQKQISCPVPVLSVSTFMNEDDIHTIRQAIEHLDSMKALFPLLSPSLFFHIHAKDRDDLLKQQIALIQKVLPLPANFYDQVILREKMGSTEYDNRIAMPHPLSIHDAPEFISAAVLDKPITWNRKPVQIVFLLCAPSSPKAAAFFFERIGKIICSDEAARQLISCTSFEEFMQCISAVH